MNLPSLAIFDMDGLIFDTERLFMEFLKKNASDFGYTVTAQAYAETTGLAGDHLLQKLHEQYGPKYPHAEISARSRADLNTFANAHGLPVKKGIPELLAFFAQQKVPCCVASSTATCYVRQYLERSGLSKWFSLVTGGDRVTRSKPDPDIFLISCSHFDVRPQDALVLEDSENGLRAAHNGKIPAICIPDLKYPSADYRDYACLIADSAFDVIRYFS